MMAMVKCKECNMLISSKAKACPSCGYARKKTSVVTWLALFTFVVIGINIASQDSNPRPVPVELSKAEKEAKAESERRGTAIFKAEYVVRENLKDSDSAKFGKSYFKEPYSVCGVVNAKNSFGGFTGDKGYIVEFNSGSVFIEGSTESFAAKWKKFCS